MGQNGISDVVKVTDCRGRARLKKGADTLRDPERASVLKTSNSGMLHGPGYNRILVGVVHIVLFMGSVTQEEY